MNTLFSYLYRDAGNYKYYADVILEGELVFERLRPFLHEHDFFIPSVVGLRDLQPTELTVDDHIWHEIIALRKTEKCSACGITSQELMLRFHKAHISQWNEREILSRMFIP